MENGHEKPRHDAAWIAKRFFDGISTAWDIAGGTFVTSDGMLLTISLHAKDKDASEWETYDGMPFPADIQVTQHIRPPDAALEDEDPLAIEYTLQLHNGTPRCVRLCIDTPDGRREIRAKDLEHIRIDDVLEAALLQLSLWKRSATPRQRRDGVATLMRRRRTTPDDIFREVARIYEENIDDAPTQAVSDHFGISKSAADKRVRRARDAGYITKTAKAGRRPQK